jgi:hypothetical protein
MKIQSAYRIFHPNEVGWNFFLLFQDPNESTKLAELTQFSPNKLSSNFATYNHTPIRRCFQIFRLVRWPKLATHGFVRATFCARSDMFRMLAGKK